MNDIRQAFEHALVDGERIDEAIAVVARYLELNAGDPVARAYFGSLNAMKAGRAVLPWVKLKHANIAAELLDQAYQGRIEMAPTEGDPGDYPGELVILLLRGIAYASFPPFLGRAAAARDSLYQAVHHPAFPHVPAAHRALALSHLAKLDPGTTAGLAAASGRPME